MGRARLLIAAIIALVAIVTYYGSTSVNPLTGETQRVAMSPEQVAEAGYDPRAMIRVMGVLAKASGGSRQPEFVSTHPAPENRAARIREEIARHLPGGVPGGLIK